MTMQVEFVSPEDVLYSGEGDQVVARTRGGGEIAFLTGHEPFIGSLVPCEVRVTETSGSVARFAVRGGFVSVSGTKVTVLSEYALSTDEIDVDRARSDLEEARTAEEADPADPERRMERQWAEVRLAAAGQAVNGAGH